MQSTEDAWTLDQLHGCCGSDVDAIARVGCGACLGASRRVFAPLLTYSTPGPPFSPQLHPPFDPDTHSYYPTMATANPDLSAQCTAVRTELKAWEKDFALQNGGRKAGRRDIKANAHIGAWLPRRPAQETS